MRVDGFGLTDLSITLCPFVVDSIIISSVVLQPPLSVRLVDEAPACAGCSTFPNEVGGLVAVVAGGLSFGVCRFVHATIITSVDSKSKPNPAKKLGFRSRVSEFGQIRRDFAHDIGYRRIRVIGFGFGNSGLEVGD